MPALGSENWKEEGDSEVTLTSHPKVDPFLCVCDRLLCSCDCTFLMMKSPLPTEPALLFWTVPVIKPSFFIWSPNVPLCSFGSLEQHETGLLSSSHLKTAVVSPTLLYTNTSSHILFFHFYNHIYLFKIIFLGV